MTLTMLLRHTTLNQTNSFSSILVNASGFLFRILNLDLLQEYGANSWKSYNDTLVKMLEQAQKQLAELK